MGEVEESATTRTTTERIGKTLDDTNSVSIDLFN